MKKSKDFIRNNKQFIISMAILFLGNMFMYWVLKLFQRNPIYINFYLDDEIPFWGWAVYIYNLFYPFSIISFFLLYNADKKVYFKGVISAIIGCIACYIIYLLLPTIMYRPIVPEYDAFTNFVIKVTFFFDDPPLNCFPSLHCLFCFQVMFSFIKAKYPINKKVIIMTIAIAIVISTLFVKQHFIYDILSALSICIMANVLESLLEIYNRFNNKRVFKN